MKVPSIWLDHPDLSEAIGIQYKIETIEIAQLTNIGWATKSIKDGIKKAINNQSKIPLLLVEKDKDVYKLHDGQHRFAAYIEVFINQRFIQVAVFNSV